MGLYRLSRFIVNRHYADSSFRPAAKLLALARIAEREGDYHAAESDFKAATESAAGQPDAYLYLGQYYERRHNAQLAIRTYEQALALSTQEPRLTAALEKRLQLLRSST